MRLYCPRVALVSRGLHVRTVPGHLAAAMVTEGIACADQSGGRVKSIELTASAATHATRTGDASAGFIGNVRFTRIERLPESGTRIFQHHPRCFY
jgi:hypothetical protein